MAAVEVASLFATLDLRDTMSDGLRRGERNLDGFEGRVRGAMGGVKSAITGAIAIGGGLAAAFGGAQAIGSAMEFDRTMANIRAITGATADETKTLGDELIAIGSKSVAGPQAVAAAYTDIVGGVQDVSTHMAILDASIATAEAGQASLATTTSGLVSVMNAYSFEADKAAFVSDVFTQTVGVGVGSMEEFVSSMSPIASTMQAAGIGFEDLGGMMAYMTTKGVGASMAATQVRAAAIAFLNPNERMRQGPRRLGVASGSALIEQEGLAGALTKLGEVTGGSVDEMTGMLGSVEALSAAMILSGPEFENFATDFESGMQGATEAARALQLDSASAKFDVFKAGLEGLAISVGNLVLPALTELTNGVSTVVGGITEFANDVSTMGLGPAIEKWWNAGVEWLQTNGPALLEGAVHGALQFATDVGAFVSENAPKIADGIKGWIEGAWEWLKAEGPGLFQEAVKGAFSLGIDVVEWLVSNAPDIATGIVDWFKGAWDWFTTDGWQWVQDMLGGAIDGIGEAFGITNLTEKIGDLGGRLKTLVEEKFNEFKNTLETGIIGDAFTKVKTAIEVVWNGIFGEGPGTIRQTFSDAINAVKDFLETSGIAAAFESIFGVVTGIIDGVTGAINGVIDGLRQILGLGPRVVAIDYSIRGSMTSGIHTTGARTGGGFGGVPQNAGGGPVSGPTIVGERGAELFVPATAGTIYPAHYGPSGETVVPVTLELDGRVIYETVIKQRNQRNYRGW